VFRIDSFQEVLTRHQDRLEVFHPRITRHFVALVPATAWIVAESHDLITLRRINRHLGRVVAIAVHELDKTLIPQEKVQDLAKPTKRIRARMNLEYMHKCLLQFKKSTVLHQFAFRMVRNDGPAQRVVVISNTIHPKSYHVDSITIKGESSSPIQLKTPATGDLAQNIEQKRTRCDIDVHNVPFRIDVGKSH
jgi:hypothetical protein